MRSPRGCSWSTMAVRGNQAEPQVSGRGGTVAARQRRCVMGRIAGEVRLGGYVQSWRWLTGSELHVVAADSTAASVT
jgi:hypothetical protein